MAELIATGTSATSSSDITVAAGSTATIFLKDADGGAIQNGARVLIEIKDTAGNYTTIGELNYQVPCLVIAGAGTYRVRRLATGISVGVGQG